MSESAQPLSTGGFLQLRKPLTCENDSYRQVSIFSHVRRFIGDNPDTVKKFVKSHIDAVHLMKTDRETGLKVLAKYLRQKQDREILQRTYDQSVTDAILPRKQYPDLAGIKTVLDLIGDSRAARAKPEQFVDMRFVKELDETGYIDNLYKRASKDR